MKVSVPIAPGINVTLGESCDEPPVEDKGLFDLLAEFREALDRLNADLKSLGY